MPFINNYQRFSPAAAALMPLAEFITPYELAREYFLSVLYGKTVRIQQFIEGGLGKI